MSAVELPVSRPHNDDSSMARLIQLLESLDNLFHVIVAMMFVVMATLVIVHTCIVSARHLPDITQQVGAKSANVTESNAPKAKDEPIHSIVQTKIEVHEPDLFLHDSLEMLSSLLFIVIILELLRTILTYLQTHNIQTIMREFIVVGIISSVRKILLVGAESSLTGSKGMDFVQDAAGTLLTILGILLLIFGLRMLESVFGNRKKPPEATE